LPLFMSRKTKRNHPLVKWKYHPPRTKGEARAAIKAVFSH